MAPYEIVVEASEEAGGAVEPATARFESLVALLAIGATGGRVKSSRGVAKLGASFYRRLGFNAEMVGETLAVEPAETSTPSTTRILLPCDVVAVSMFSLVAGIASPLGSRIIIGVNCDWMVEHNFNYLIEAASQLGIRIWRTTSASNLLVVEPKAATPKAYRDFVRLVGRVPGYILAAVATAAAWTGRRVNIVVTGVVEGRRRLERALNVLTKLGVRVEADERRISVEGPPTVIDYEAPSGYAETLVAAALASLETTLGEPSEGDEELLAAVKAFGLEAACGSRRGECRLTVRHGEPRSAAVSCMSEPEVATVALAAIASLQPSAAIIGGLETLSAEGVRASDIEKLLRSLGAEAFAEEDRVVLLAWTQPSAGEAGSTESETVKLECSLGVERQCYAAAIASAKRFKRVIVVGERDVDEVLPGLPRVLEQLGARITVRRLA